MGSQVEMDDNPIFQVSFTLQMSPALMQLEGTTSSPMEFDNGTARFDLLAELWEADGGVSGRFEYDTDLFDKSTIHRMIANYAALLESIVAEPAGHISKLNLLPESEKQQVLYAWNQTDKEFPRDAKLHELIEGDPHRLLEGMALAAYAIGATKAYIYIRAEYPLALERLAVAVCRDRQDQAYRLQRRDDCQ